MINNSGKRDQIVSFGGFPLGHHGRALNWGTTAWNVSFLPSSQLTQVSWESIFRILCLSFLPLFFFSCVYVCTIHVCMNLYMSVHMHMGAPELLSGIILNHSCTLLIKAEAISHPTAP